MAAATLPDLAHSLLSLARYAALGRAIGSRAGQLHASRLNNHKRGAHRLLTPRE